MYFQMLRACAVIAIGPAALSDLLVADNHRRSLMAKSRSVRSSSVFEMAYDAKRDDKR
jgi:hypothetical protein